ncbi:MAG: hypothetical protein LBI17_01115 [Rickettsiales bacterium]|jgi:hypothetical protein|nr:hypothetical protein [Rickettsiales bacterium]
MKKIFPCAAAIAFSALCVPAESKTFDSFLGEWEYGREYDNASGSLVIEDCEDGEGLCFEIFTIVRWNDCGLDGKFETKSPTEAEADVPSEEGKKCHITFKLDTAGTIHVDSDGDGCACGLNATFDGKYVNKEIPATYETGFDCAKAESEQEKLICKDKDLALYDRKMNELYKMTSGQGAVQKAWLKKRNGCGIDKKCIDTAYTERFKELKNAVDAEAFEDIIPSFSINFYCIHNDCTEIK